MQLRTVLIVALAATLARLAISTPVDVKANERRQADSTTTVTVCTATTVTYKASAYSTCGGNIRTARAKRDLDGGKIPHPTAEAIKKIEVRDVTTTVSTLCTSTSLYMSTVIPTPFLVKAQGGSRNNMLGILKEGSDGQSSIDFSGQSAGQATGFTLEYYTNYMAYLAGYPNYGDDERATTIATPESRVTFNTNSSTPCIGCYIHFPGNGVCALACESSCISPSVTTDQICPENGLYNWWMSKYSSKSGCSGFQPIVVANQ